MHDQAREAGDWVLEQVAEACGTTPDLILARPKSLPVAERQRAARGFRVACAVLRRLGLRPQQIAEVLGATASAVQYAIGQVRQSHEDVAIVNSILAMSEARQFAEQLGAAQDVGSLADRLDALEQRVLSLESAVRRLSDADFRRLDALILAGWGDVRQDKIPADVLIRALLGLPVPPPPGNGQKQGAGGLGEGASSELA